MVSVQKQDLDYSHRLNKIIYETVCRSSMFYEHCGTCNAQGILALLNTSGSERKFHVSRQACPVLERDLGNEVKTVSYSMHVHLLYHKALVFTLKSKVSLAYAFPQQAGRDSPDSRIVSSPS